MIGFICAAVVLVATAVFVVTAQKPVYSVVGLLVHFAALAALYFSLSAEFLGVIQIIVYSGAILILFVFVIALLSSGVAPFREGPDRLPRMLWPVSFGIAVFLAALLYGVSRVQAPAPSSAARGAVAPVGAANAFGSIHDFGLSLLTTNLLPFEITAFILLVAVIGVILLVGDLTPYAPTRKRARLVDRDVREAVVREGRH